MNLYEYQRSGSLDSTFYNSFSVETARPIEAKFNMKPKWDGGMKIYSNGPGYMTSMAPMPIYGKKSEKIFFSGIERLMTLNIGTSKFVQMVTLGSH